MFKFGRLGRQAFRSKTQLCVLSSRSLLRSHLSSSNSAYSVYCYILDRIHQRSSHLIRFFLKKRFQCRLNRSLATGLIPTFAAISLFKTKVTQEMDSDTGSKKEQIESALKKANEFYTDNKFEDVFNTLVQFENEVDHCELQWKLARAARDLSQLDATSKERKEKLYYDGFKYAENAVKADDNNSAAHKWKGILLSDVSKFEGYKKQISNAYVIRDEFVRASELNAEDALPHFLLGEWCYSVSDMGWMQRKFAQALFGTPPTSSFEDAYRHFTKAEQVKSGFYVGNYVSLGKTCLKLKKKDEAKTWFNKAAQYKSENEKDDKLIAEAKDLLKTL